ncbi:hypothetical protein AHF37_11346, partial [Paragonimus kellicotti]
CSNILLRLNSDNLRHLASFELPSKPSPSLCHGNPEAPCQEQSAFNLLSKTYDQQNLWYCYVYQTNYMNSAIISNVDSARCEIPMVRLQVFTGFLMLSCSLRMLPCSWHG